MHRSPSLLRRTLGWVAIGLIAAAAAPAHTLELPSIYDTVEAIRQRLATERTTVGLAGLKPAEVLALLTPEERRLLGETFLAFELDAEARVSVVLPAAAKDDPFWLAARGFTPTKQRWRIGSDEFTTWSRVFPAGHVQLGVPSLGGTVEAYFVVVSPLADGGPVPVLTEPYPGQLRADRVALGARPYADGGRRIEEAPPEFLGHALLRTLNERKADGRLFNLYRLTRHPGTTAPDQVVLTWSGDPRVEQTVRWRTAPTVGTGAVAWAEKSAGQAFDPRAAGVRRITARTSRLDTPDIANDPVNHLHQATLAGLQPGTTYVYAVGDGGPGGWSAPAEFTTAPATAAPFTFVYMGDAQNGLESWGRLVGKAYASHPEAAFYVMAGDLINRGRERDDWDDYFANAGGIFARRPLVPCIGNHETQGGHPSLYLRHFALPANGPAGLEPGRAYALRYGNALFVVLDSNLSAEAQAPWLEAQLRDTDATWKFAVYHHPAYASRPGRSYPDVVKHWVPLFDKYHVDLALQGHDHAYLRTYPLKGGARVPTARDGTIYLLTVSGTKFYDQGDHAYTEVGFTKVATYQVLDIRIAGDELRYRSYDVDGRLRDEFLIRK
jgi:hypothetical protein